MSLPNGTAIGPYEIVGWLGAGGMGEVYRARDPRLGRDVAIKLISTEVATDRSRVHRFEQEARAAGQLNHPNVLAVYDIGTHAGSPYIVSELLEGQTLGPLLTQELSVRRAVDYARQTAEGLGAAHAKNIVHRDLKPDNLFVTADGRVKILDFGIAKLTQPADGAGRQTGSPTATHPGLILGTVGYMSPEQVRGEEVDHRSDLFSLGVILYEMLSGHRAFDRGSAAETIVSILKEDPLDRLGPQVPSSVVRVVTRCLEKSREARFQSARDLAFALESASSTNVAATGPTGNANRFGWLRQLPVPWIVAGALAVALALVLSNRPPPAAPIAMPWMLSAELSPGLSLANAIDSVYGHSIDISATGDLVVFAAPRGPGQPRQLLKRRGDQEVAQALPGTDEANSPFISPSGRWIGFFAGPDVKKIAVTGGAATTVAVAQSFRGGAWENDDSIVFSPGRTEGTALVRVSADGRGTPTPIGALAPDEVIQVWPQILPGGRGVLYTGSATPGAFNDANIMVQPPSGGVSKVVHRGGYHGRYLSSGHLVYVHDGQLFAVSFDLQRLEKTSEPVSMLTVASQELTGGAQFAVSANGTLVFRPGQDDLAELLLVERDGKATPLPIPPQKASNLAFSPRDDRLAMDIRGDGEPNIRVYEPGKPEPFKLTTDPARAIKPVWTDDGRRIAYASSRGDRKTLNIWWQLAAGGGGLQRLTTSPNTQQPGSWHKSGKYLAFVETRPETKSDDLMILPMEGDEASGWTPGAPVVFAESPSNESSPAFAPNGEWMAYDQNRGGSRDVYVRPFQRPGAEVKISIDGGTLATWSRTTNELFYRKGVAGAIMVVSYAVEGDVFRPGAPQQWSDGRYRSHGPNRMFDLHHDGTRFVVASPPAPLGDHVTFIFDFFERLRRLTPPAGR